MRPWVDHVVLVTPPPVDDPGRLRYQVDAYGDNATGVLERSNGRAKQYADAVLRVAARAGVPALDLWTDMQASPRWQEQFRDGLHFTPKGQQAVHGHLVELLREHAPSVIELPTDFPHHSKLDFADPGPSFWRHRRGAGLE